MAKPKCKYAYENHEVTRWVQIIIIRMLKYEILGVKYNYIAVLDWFASSMTLKA